MPSVGITQLLHNDRLKNMKYLHIYLKQPLDKRQRYLEIFLIDTLKVTTSCSAANLAYHCGQQIKREDELALK